MIALLFQIFINNSFVNSVSGKTFHTINPANKNKIVDVAEADKVRLYNFIWKNNT